jgi:HlyD family secretion protein
MKLSSRHVLSSVMVLVIGVLAYWGYSTWKKPVDNQRYRTVVIARGDVAQTVSATGTLNPVRVVSVGTQVSGTVKNCMSILMPK